MTFRTLSVVSILLLLTGPALAQSAAPSSMVLWKPGQRVELKLQTGEVVRGRISLIEPTSVTLLPEPHGIAARHIDFTDVRFAKTKWTRTQKWTLAGGIYGALLVLGIILGK